MADELDQHFLDAELLRLEALASREAGASIADTVALLGAAIDAAEARGLTSLALRAACDLATFAPKAAESVGVLLKQIEGGRGTRDHSRALLALAAQDP